MSSAVLFFIYLLLNDVTVRRKKRNIRGKSMLDGIIVMVIIIFHCSVSIFIDFIR